MQKPRDIRRRSAIRSIDARVKIVSMLFFISVVAISTDVGILLTSLLFIFGLILLSRISSRVVATRYLLAMPFIGFASLSLYFVSSFQSAIVMFIRISTCVLGVILISGSTSLLGLLEGLKRLRFPRILLILMLFTYRYIHVFKEEMESIRTARKARGGRKGKHLLDRGFMRSLSTMTGMIIVRAFWRGDRIYDALRMRQYNGDLHLQSKRHLSFADFGFGLFVASVSLTLALANFGVILWI